MPIILDDITSAATKQRKVTPKYFKDVLTGDGGIRGLINDRLKPGRKATGSTVQHSSIKALNMLSKSTNNKVTIRHIPFGPLSIDSMVANKDAALQLPVPHLDDMLHLNEGRTNNKAEIYFNLTPQGGVFRLDESGENTHRELQVLYRMELYALQQGSTPDQLTIISQAPMSGTNHEYAMIDFSFGPLDDLEQFLDRATRVLTHNGQALKVDEDKVNEWFADYNLYDAISNQAEIWDSEAIGVVMSDHIAQIYASADPTDGPTETQLHQLAYQLRYLEQYTVPLEAYKTIYQQIHAVAPVGIAHQLAKQNLNLLMNHTQLTLDALKPQLQKPQVTQAALDAVPPYLSTQQRNAVTTEAPLSLSLAGAGTGKSTAILERIKFLTNCGVQIEDITVLSFTNAAADNIKEKNPGVGSMTIASMIHDIYSLNYPNHDLSSIDTILNSLEIFYPNNDFASAFHQALVRVKKNETGATTELNVFIEKYLNETLTVLDSIAQTCLELEIILCYQLIDSMQEPAHVQSKYLIIDEVQDNSIFEFIFTLKYVAKHKENLFIVGDASQTLYEFRAANPKALNALEGSGVFATYQLTTNYRSNQEILDFANVHLSDIEANSTAKLRLQANSLEQPTAQSFQEKVQLKYCELSRMNEFESEYPNYLRTMVKPYIDEALAKNEKIAFLMFTRRMVKITEETLQQMYPNQEINNLVSDKAFSTTVFSNYIKKFWNNILQTAPKDASFAVSRDILNNLALLTQVKHNPKGVERAVTGFIHDWWTDNNQMINSWVALHQQQGITTDEFFDRLRSNMLEFEISKNAARQSVLNQRNRQRKEDALKSNALINISTIHGAKGLEFDNVVVIHKYSPAIAEDVKRMNYVAFTRAMKTELILSYGTQRNPHIQADYDSIVAALTTRDQEAALRAMGIDPDDATEEQAKYALDNFDNLTVQQAKQDQAYATATDDEKQLHNDQLTQDQHDSDDDAADDPATPADPAITLPPQIAQLLAPGQPSHAGTPEDAVETDDATSASEDTDGELVTSPFGAMAPSAHSSPWDTPKDQDPA